MKCGIFQNIICRRRNLKAGQRKPMASRPEPKPDFFSETVRLEREEKAREMAKQIQGAGK